ncbi:MAG TPA: GNAT family N-acetyltransferase [Vicinamibacterales bacterium]
MIEIRPALASDSAALAGLRWAFRAGRAPAVENEAAFLARCDAWMAREIASGSPWRCWVASRDSAIVGQVWLQLLSKLPNPVGERDRHAYLSNLYVIPAARGGVGTRLLESALAWAEENRVDRVVLWPTPDSTRLYERHGFVRVGDVMEMTCGQPS